MLLLLGCAKSIEERQIVKKDKNITIKLEAVVYPSVNHKVTSLFSGKIKYVFAKNGQKVKKGDKLYQFNTKELILLSKTLSYEINVLKKQILRDAKNKQNLPSIDSSVLENAKSYLNKITRLYAEGYATESELTNAKRDYFNLKKDYDNIKYNNQNKNEAFKLSKDSKLILLKQKQAQLEKIKSKIKNATVISEDDGYLVDSEIKIGSFVEQSAKMGSIVNIDKIILKAGLAPGLYRFVKAGDKVKVDFIVTPPYSVETTITRIIPIVDPKFGRMIVEIELDNKNYILQDGMKAMVQIKLKKEYQDIVRKYFIEKEDRNVVEISSEIKSK
jgi:multidrug resistance efflux pump